MALSPIITLEEHWCSEHVRRFYREQGKPDPNAETGLTGYAIPKLMEFGPQRLSSMDDNGVSLQVVSHAPNSIALDLATCVQVNDELHGRIEDGPKGRFAGFATLPMAEPDAAAGELRRCVQDLGFIGALIDSNCGGRYYDGTSYGPFWEAAEQLDVPIYLHPAPNEQLQNILYAGNYPDPVAEILSQYGWGWHAETAVAFLRLLAAGTFDHYPKLKIVLGHLGEMLPFQLDRTARIAQAGWPHVGVTLKRGLRQVWDENVWITMSGMFSLPPMACVLKQCKPERIMFSVDYPFGKNEDGVEFLQQLLKEGMVDQGMLEMLAYRNAEALLKVKVKS